MHVTFTARHCTPSARLRRRAEDRLRRLVRFEPHLRAAEVSFDRDHGTYVVEARLRVDGGAAIVAHGRAGAGFGAALGPVVERLGRQLRRRRERRRNHRVGLAAQPLMERSWTT